MKSFRIPKSALLTDERVKNAFMKASKGKRSRADVAEVLNNLEEHITILQETLWNGTFKPPIHADVVINERNYLKERTIRKPDYKYEQVVHHIAVDAIKESIEHGMYDFVLGSVPGRGPHLGKKYIERWIRKDLVNTKYVFKMDIHHFFQSVDHNILKAWLRKKFRDQYLLDLLFLIIDACDMGLALGFYTSQWFANFLLQPLDHYIKEVLRVKYMTRYMDDVVCFGANKKELHKVAQAVINYLREELHLTMKGNWQIFRFEYEVEEKVVICDSIKNLYQLRDALIRERIKCRIKMDRGKRKLFIRKASLRRKEEAFNWYVKRFHATTEERISIYGRPLDYMGFEFHRNRTIMRKGILIRAVRKARRIFKGEKICWKLAASFLSSMGWFDHTDTYAVYLDRIKPIVSVKAMKKLVSKHQRRVNRENRMGSSGGLPANAA